MRSGDLTTAPLTAAPPPDGPAAGDVSSPAAGWETLTGVSAWPNVRATHVYTRDRDGTPVLRIAIALDTADYDGDPAAAERGLATYRRIGARLREGERGRSVTRETEHALGLQLRNSLIAAHDVPLDDVQAETVRAFVEDCVRFLATTSGASIAGTPLVAQRPAATLVVPVSRSAARAGSVLAIELSLTVARRASDDAASGADAAADEPVVAFRIAPLSDADGSNRHTAFAAAFEDVWRTPAWSLRAAEELEPEGERGAVRGAHMWAVRLAEPEGDGLRIRLGASASYFAPAPIARELASGTVDVVDYPTGRTVPTHYTSVDQGCWLRTALDAVDRFLTPPCSTAVSVLDTLPGIADAPARGYLADVLAASRSLAESITATLRPILSTGAADASTAWHAAEALRRSLLDRLGATYATGTAAVFEVEDTTEAPPRAGGRPTTLFGQVATSFREGAGSPDVALTPARVPLGPTTVADPDGGTSTYEPRLAFVLAHGGVPWRGHVPVDVTYAVTHLEVDRADATGSDGSARSCWLALVTGPLRFPLGTRPSNVPVANRALPLPPMLDGQSAERHAAAPATVRELAAWDYRVEYRHADAAGEPVRITIAPDGTPPSIACEPGGDSTLFAALAQFVAAYPAIERDLEEHLVPLATGTPDDDMVRGATRAVAAFVARLRAVAAAHRVAVAPREPPARRATPARASAASPRLEFTHVLSADADGRARTDVFDVTIEDVPATYDAATGTVGNGAHSIPAPVVEIVPARYAAEVVTPAVEGVTLSYRYPVRAPVAIPGEAGGERLLSYEEAAATAARAVVLPALDAFAHPRLLSSARAERNAVLFPVTERGAVRTDAAFRLTSPAVTFRDAVTPRLVHAVVSLDALVPPGRAGLRGQLDAFFGELFARGSGVPSATVSMTGAWSYAPPGADGAPRIVLPVCLLPPTETPVTATAPPEFTQAFAEAIDTWRAEMRPPTSGNPRIEVAVRVFDAAADGQPVFSVDDLHAAVPTGAAARA
jgi:hypothetical protein